MIHKGTTESGRVRILTGEAEQREHAYNLRMVVSAQVDSVRKRYFALYHEANNLKSLLEQESTPLGFSSYEIDEMLRKLEPVLG